LLYYDDKLKPIIDEKFKAYKKDVPVDKQKSEFAFRVSNLKELLEAETEEVKEKVEDFRWKAATAMAVKIEDDAADKASQMETAKSMQA
jgi:hypothetical protein